MVPKDRPTAFLFVRVANGIRFEWQGGQYITMFSRTKGYPKQPEDLWIDNATMREPGWYVTDMVINVWNGDTGRPRIPFTAKGFDREVDEWIASNNWQS